MTQFLTTKSYWNSAYSERKSVEPVDIASWKNLCAQEIYKLKLKHGLSKGSVLEIGGGGSSWLACLSENFPENDFTCLDYSESGCQALSKWVKVNNIKNLHIHVGDFFCSHDNLKKYDFVYSHGVVEHFIDLPDVLRSHADYLANDGIMLTIIPNMAGILGTLTRLMNREVYDIHMPHDLDSFTTGHEKAGLKLIESGYVCSNNFGVLASCVQEKKGFKWNFYKWLTRLSKATWFFEYKVANLPKSRFFSPYIYVVSKKQKCSFII